MRLSEMKRPRPGCPGAWHRILGRALLQAQPWVSHVLVDGAEAAQGVVYPIVRWETGFSLKISWALLPDG